MKEVDLYTDGACSGNPGPGGWGAVLIYRGVEKELSGGAPDTTNNRMELMAAIEGLRALREPCAVRLFTDSKYIEQAINQHWLVNWKKRGWKKADKTPVLNVDLWQLLDAELHRHKVELIWVKGHSDNAYNNRCDILAVEQSQRFKR